MFARLSDFAPGLIGYPPVFVFWRQLGAPPKSMYSKVAGISETIDEK